MLEEKGFVEDRRRFDREGNLIRPEAEASEKPEGGRAEGEAISPEQIERQEKLVAVLRNIEILESQANVILEQVSLARTELEGLYFALPARDQKEILRRLGAEETDGPRIFSKEKPIGFRPIESRPGEARASRPGPIGFGPVGRKED